MTQQVSAALEALQRGKARVSAQVSPVALLGASAVEFAMPTAVLIAGKNQITVPAQVRRRWTARGKDEKLPIVCVVISPEVLLVLPKFRARAWTATRGSKMTWEERSLQGRGHFEVPVETRKIWGNQKIVRLDLGYCLLLLPEASVPELLDGIWGRSDRD